MLRWLAARTCRRRAARRPCAALASPRFPAHARADSVIVKPLEETTRGGWLHALCLTEGERAGREAAVPRSPRRRLREAMASLWSTS